MLERLTAGTLTLDQLNAPDRAIVEYAVKSRAEQAANIHKRGGAKGGRTGIGAIKSRRAPRMRRSRLEQWAAKILLHAKRSHKSVGALVNQVWRQQGFTVVTRDRLRALVLQRQGVA